MRACSRQIEHILGGGAVQINSVTDRQRGDVGAEPSGEPGERWPGADSGVRASYFSKISMR